MHTWCTRIVYIFVYIIHVYIYIYVCVWNCPWQQQRALSYLVRESEGSIPMICAFVYITHVVHMCVLSVAPTTAPAAKLANLCICFWFYASDLHVLYIETHTHTHAPTPRNLPHHLLNARRDLPTLAPLPHSRTQTHTNTKHMYKCNIYSHMYMYT